MPSTSEVRTQGHGRWSGVWFWIACSSPQSLLKGRSLPPSKKELWLSCTSARCQHGGWGRVWSSVGFPVVAVCEQGSPLFSGGLVFRRSSGRAGSFLGCSCCVGCVGAEFFPPSLRSNSLMKMDTHNIVLYKNPTKPGRTVGCIAVSVCYASQHRKVYVLGIKIRCIHVKRSVSLISTLNFSHFVFATTM